MMLDLYYQRNMLLLHLYPLIYLPCKNNWIYSGQNPCETARFKVWTNWCGVSRLSCNFRTLFYTTQTSAMVIGQWLWVQYGSDHGPLRTLLRPMRYKIMISLNYSHIGSNWFSWLKWKDKVRFHYKVGTVWSYVHFWLHQ